MRITLKLGNMRKPQDFVVYPRNADTTVVYIQSDTRFCMFDPATGRGVLSAAHQNGSGRLDLHPSRGAMLINLSPVEVASCCSSQPKPGDQIASGIFAA